MDYYLLLLGDRSKVINGEAVAAQHRVLVMDWEIQQGKKRKPEQATPRIK